MWNEGGGFDSSQSPNIGGNIEKGPTRLQNLVPVSFKQMLDAVEADNFKVVDTKPYMITSVALVRSSDITSTRAIFLLDDTTGQLEGRFIFNKDDTGSNRDFAEIEVGSYCRIYGTHRSESGQPFIHLFVIRPLEDFNDLTTHLLEVIAAELQLKKVAKMLKDGPNFVSGTGFLTNRSNLNQSGFEDMDTSFGGGGGGQVQGLDSKQSMVFQLVDNCKEQHGVDKNAIVAQLRGKMTPKEINDILDFLSGEGHIYSTIDEDHYRSTSG